MDRSPIETALCTEAAERPAVALNVELPTDGSLPEWVELIPAGEVVGRDGRAWVNDAPDQVIDASLGTGRDIPVDWEHATEIKAPGGDPAPAAGWITALDNRDGALWGRVEWTPRGAETVRHREYRYLSPVFEYRKRDGRIMRLTSVGLTNSPNLYLSAMNRGGNTGFHPKEGVMPLPEAIRKALSLKEDATEDQAVSAINTLQGDLQTAQNRATEQPSLDKFVPRADYNTALERATNAEGRIKTIETEQLEAQVDTAIDGALKAGKITPATVEYHKAQCRQEGGLERFKAYVEAAPAVADPSGLDDRKPEGGKDRALNAEDAQIAAMFGNSAEDIKQYGQA